jgi:hypothetical protein
MQWIQEHIRKPKFADTTTKAKPDAESEMASSPVDICKVCLTSQFLLVFKNTNFLLAAFTIFMKVIFVTCFLCSPTVNNPVGGNAKCAELGVNIFFSKVRVSL